MPAKRPRAVTVLSLGLEGGGCRIMARQGPDGWVFWQAGTSMDIDLDDNETWKSFKTEPVPSLAEAMPMDWWLLYPLQVHKNCIVPVRGEYKRSKPLRARRRQHECVVERWREVLG